MTLTVSKDLSVTTAPSDVDVKLEQIQKALQENLMKGEPKIFGVSQIVLGLMIISYSIPLLLIDSTLILNFGVPWWSGIMFVISGAIAIAVEKHPRRQTLNACLAVSVVAIIVSVIALFLYYADIAYNPPTMCLDDCNHKFYVTNFSHSVKVMLTIVLMAETGMASAFTAILYQQRKKFMGYATVVE